MSLNLLTSRKSPLILPRTADELLHFRSSFRKPKRFRLLSICANAVYNVGHLVDQNFLQRYTPVHETLKYVDEFSELKKWRNPKRTHLSLSLLVDLSMHFDFPERMCMCQSLFLSIYGLDPDQTRMEFRKECFVNLKIFVHAIESRQSVVH